MHSWFELYHFGRQRTEELRRSIDETRRRRHGPAYQAADARGTLTVTRAGLQGGRATIILARGEVLSLRVRSPLTVSCLAGQLWATMDGRPDALLEPRSGASVAGKGLLVIEALRTATVTLECLRPAPLRIGLAPRQPATWMEPPSAGQAAGPAPQPA